jgi:purine-binding chemotaxis protein CheW
MIINNHSKYLKFTVNSDSFVIALDCIQSIIDSPIITKIPKTSPDIAGLLNFRGSIVTVIDMGLMLKKLPAFNNKKFFVLVIEFADELYGLLVNSVAEIIGFEESNKNKTFENFDVSIKSISDGFYQTKDHIYISVAVDSIIKQFL